MSEGKKAGSTTPKKTKSQDMPNKKTTPSKIESKKSANNKDSKESKENPNHLPLARIRTIMKSAPDADLISQEALVLVCRAAEMFIQQMTKESHMKSQKQNHLEYKDLAAVVAADEKLEFLASIIPKKITVKEYKKRLAEESSSDDASYEDSEASESESGSEEESEEEDESDADENKGNATIELSSDGEPEENKDT